MQVPTDEHGTMNDERQRLRMNSAFCTHRSALIHTSRMLKKSASGVLASLRSSTYRSVRLASSLAAALLDSLFEHPARGCSVVLDVLAIEFPPCHNSFSADS